MGKKLFYIFLLIFIFTACSNTSKKTEPEKVPPEKQSKYLMIRGINFAEKGNMKEAMENLKKSYEINPKDVITVRSIGLVYSKLGDFENGEKYFEEALKIDKTDTLSLYNLGIMYYQKKEYQKSIEYFNEIKIEQINDDIRRAKAYTYYNLKEYEKSSTEFQNIDFINKTYDIDFYNIYIDVLEKTDKKNEVYPLIYKVYEKNKEKAAFNIMFANYLETMGAYDDAIEILKQYGIRNKFNKNVVLAMCKIAFIEEKYEDVSKFLNFIPQENRFDEDVLKMRLNYFKVIGNEEEAVKIERILNKIKGTEENEKNMEKSDI